MELYKYVVFAAAVLLLCCHSAEVKIGRRLKRDADTTLEKILEVLTAQDEKINRLQTMVVINQFLPKCTAALKSSNLIAANNCWNSMTTEIKMFDHADTTIIKVMSQLVTDSYDGEQSRLMRIAKFIKDNVEKGSDLANGGYKALINAIDIFGHLYLKDIDLGNGLGSGLVDYTYRTLSLIRNAEGEASPVFTQIIPAAVNSILSGKEVFIRNNVTRDFMYAPSGSDDSVTKILVNGGGDVTTFSSDPRYIWKLKPAEFRWTKYNEESFYIENTFENKILSVAGGDGSLKLVEQTEESLKSAWSIFFVPLVRGSIGDEVAILCSYWGIKTLNLEENEKIPKLLETETLENIPTAIWNLHPKV